MQLIRRLSGYRPDAPLALAIGNFDGLHRGHQAVLARTHALASELKLVPAVLTFEPHPRQFFAPGSPAFRLQTLRDKLGSLRDAGIEKIFALKFDAAFAGMSAEDFLERILRTRMNGRAIITGENFSYGSKRSGDIATLRRWGDKHGIVTEQLAPLSAEGDVCSSTAVRHALGEGNVQHAAALLGRPYTLSGRVKRGHKKGHELGYPTVNIAFPVTLKLPRHGIYAVTVRWNGQRKRGVASLGLRPTLNPVTSPLLEVHMFDFTGDLYGQRLEIDLHAWLREEKRFDSLAALTHQIAQDAKQAQDYLQEHDHG